MTEDETVTLLIQHLEKRCWKVDSSCLVHQKGCDIIASKNNSKLYIEVKGAKAGSKSPTKKREYFDGGQIKTHFGRAIVKTLEDKFAHPDSLFAIAHPEDARIRNAIGKLIPFLKTMGIKHFWVSPDGSVIEE